MEVDGVSDGHPHDGAGDTERHNSRRDLWPGAAGIQSSKIEERDWKLGSACEGRFHRRAQHGSWLILRPVPARGVECFVERNGGEIPHQARSDVLYPNLFPHVCLLCLHLW